MRHCPVFISMSWQSCPLCPVQAQLSRLTCQADLYRLTSPVASTPSSHVSDVLSQLACHICPIPAVLSYLSGPCYHVLAVLFSLSYPQCTFLTVFPNDKPTLWLSCPSCPVQTTLSRSLLRLPVLYRITCRGCRQADLSRLT